MSSRRGKRITSVSLENWVRDGSMAQATGSLSDLRRARCALAWLDVLPKVLQIGKFYPPFRGGMESHLKALSEGIARDVQVKVVVSNTARVSVEEKHGPVTVLRLARQFSILRAPVCLGLRAAIREFEPDLIHIHLPNPAAVMSVLASGYHGPMVATYHNDIMRKRVLVHALEPMLRMLLHRCGAVIATSRNYAATSPTLRAVADRTHVIHPGIDPRRFARANAPRVSAIREKYGERMVIAVGRLIYYKGFEYLIDAMSSVDARLVIVGEGPLHESLLRRAEEAGLAQRITFAGGLSNDEMVNHLHAARVFVLPACARSEAFGIVQLEAMAAGLPVINTRLDSGVPFVSIDGRTGITVEPKNAQALATAINDLLADPARARAMGEAGKRRVANTFTAEHMCDATLALYRSLGVSRTMRVPQLMPAQSG